jgi:hemerythrin superfamily protein
MVSVLLLHFINLIKGDALMNALELLSEDHKKVKELFEKAENAEGKEQQKIFDQIKRELETHTRIEETIFYPAVQQHEELKDMVLESLEEHKQVKTLLKEMDALASDSEKFEPKLKVLQENVEHHAEEEEEGKMFPKLRDLMDEDELEELGAELEAAKQNGQKRRKAS